jgi:hypothetical protein
MMKTYIRLAIATNSLSGLEQVLDLRERGLEEMAVRMVLILSETFEDSHQDHSHRPTCSSTQ